MKKHLIKSHGKCILSGEHSVLRGYPALVFPLLSCGITLTFSETGLPVTVDIDSIYSDTLLVFFWGILEAALKRLVRRHSDISGHFLIHNTIPLGAGLGFSAAFCAVFGQWFLYKNWIQSAQLVEFCRHLENSFHGHSSGVDIAGALASQAILFESVQKLWPLRLNWQPQLYLSYSNQTSITAKCVEIVEGLLIADPSFGKKVDVDMCESVLLAEKALSQSPQLGLASLKTAIEIASHCFQRWGLISSDMEKHMQLLQAAGAVAVKPTGAGNGGYILSLWEDKPPDNLGFELLPTMGML